MRHVHDWRPAAPINPARDPGNIAAQIVEAATKTKTFACACGATKMELTTNGRVNRYVTTSSGRLWRGHRRLRRRARVGAHG
jgi:hypothetical protein